MNDTPSSQPARTGYAPVNGLKMYFEIHGPSRPDVPPLVLLHGGGDTIETSFGQFLPLLTSQRPVIAFEQQGYGRTADIADRPFTFEQSAKDTAALLDYLHVDRTDLFGFSNGGGIALHMAMQHPQLARRIIAVTAIMKRDWCQPQFWESMKTAKPQAVPRELRDAYIKVAPDPENFESFFYKSRNRTRDFKDVPDSNNRDRALQE